MTDRRVCFVKATVQSPPQIESNRLIGRALRRARSEPTFGRLFVRFALTGLVAMLIIAVVSFIIVRRTATKDAIQQATQLTELAGRGIAEPLITPGVLSGDPQALAQLNRVVHGRILRDTPIVRVKIWNDRGQVLYSDATELIGTTFTLGRDELAALRTGTTDSDDSDLSHPENRTERAFKHLIEVYVGIRGPNGGRLLYEDYERSSTIASDSQKEWTSLLPALVGALLFLYLIQLPLAYSLAQRLRTGRREHERLLQRAIDASDLERRRIAADLHDGAVQRLAGVSLSLAASSRSARPQDSSLAIETAAAETRDVIRELRTLLVDIYPPTLQRAGLQSALADLVAPLQKAGVEVNLDVPEASELSEGTVALLYRVAQEAVRNARTHSHATEVDVQLQVQNHKVSLIVADNGRGFTPPGDGDRDGRGHFGLRLIHDLVAHAGGHVSVTSALGAGTRLEVTVNQP